MSDADDKRDQKLSLSGRSTLQLRRTVDTGQVRQSFSHGRSKPVVVERRRKRVVPPAGGAEETARGPEVETEVQEAAPSQESQQDSHSGRGRVILKSLTAEEKASRARALDGARKAAEEARRKAAQDAEHHAVEEARLKAEHDAAEKRREEEEARKKSDEDARRKAAEEADRRIPEKPKTDGEAKTDIVLPRDRKLVDEEEESEVKRKRGKAVPKVAPRRDEPRRRGRLTVTTALSGDEERQRSLAAFRRAREREKRHMRGAAEPPSKIFREVVIPETITVQELANRMAERAVDVIKLLMKMDIMATINQTLDADTAELIVTEMGHTFKRVSEADVELGLTGEEDEPENLESRSPVVTIMGHVDHGKTSLLDALRATDVAAGEAGGITQHIGAYQVTLKTGQKITFLDTPGHEAFTAMRSRGAQVTDIVVLVVAADDGIMPQTVEAIHHAKAAGVPIIVAINKMDKPGAEPDRIRNELLQHEVVVEQMGGDVLNVEVSAIKQTNLDKLEEAILLQAEVLELKANPNRPAEGAIVEAKLDRGRGPVATVLVQRGTLHVGDVVVAGANWGRVRALIDDHGQQVEEAGPSKPVEILGLSSTPDAGDDFAVVSNEARAREVTAFRQRRARTTRTTVAPVSLENIFSEINKQRVKELPIVVKTDVQGSAEAIVGALNGLGTEEVAVRIMHSGVGAISESDVTLAKASSAPIIGFNVRATKQAEQLAEAEGIEIRYYSVIYDLVDDLKKVLSGMLAPEVRETKLGEAEVREVFAVSKAGKVAGCLVTDGVVRRGAMVRLLRDNVVVHEGALSSLRRFKDEVREVQAGTECGIAIENYQDVKVGDMIEVFERTEVARSL
jgi:translation initiation factor IF-2